MKICGLILLAPAIEVSNKRSPLLSTRAWHNFGSFFLRFSKITETPFEADTVDPNEREFPERIRFLGRSTTDETFRLIDANRSRGPELQVPTMVVIALQDNVIDNQAAKDFYESLTCPNKRLLELENSGHNMQVDFQWEFLTKEIKKFCDEQLRSKAAQDARSQN